jgi:hypothetical protein
MKICICINYIYCGLFTWLSVEAELLHDIAPHIHCATFALHKDFYGVGHVVTNIETGSRVARSIGRESKIHLIARAKALLANKTDADVMKALKREAGRLANIGVEL